MSGMMMVAIMLTRLGQSKRAIGVLLKNCSSKLKAIVTEFTPFLLCEFKEMGISTLHRASCSSKMCNTEAIEM
eukprot:691438-Amphidinium_carterae.1